ncbi:cadherin-like domain-containing protein [Flavimaribacter sediminis]|uniref:cadherin-like domain-containing protein n=1 Tax=Flavimaribacter sediminis TaxID=2865987 RepID=UPI00351E105B
MNAGAGDDIVLAGNGNDTIIHVEADNPDNLDLYDGGNGRDTISLIVSQTTFTSEEFQAELAALQAMIVQTGSASGGFASLGIELRSFEVIEVVVDDSGNQPPTVALENVTASLAEDTDTGTRIKVADIVISDDILGTNALSLSGLDAGLFEIVGTELYLKAGVSLDFESSPALNVSVLVDDATVGATPDDAATLLIAVTNINETPVATAVDLGAIDEDGSRIITAAELLAGASDVDSPSLGISDLSIQTGGGALVDNNDGTWTYTPDADDDSEVTFVFTASDGELTASSTASLDLTPVNDAPVATAVDLGAIDEDGSLVIAAAELLAGVSDIDGPATSITDLSIQTGGGSLVDNNDGTWTYTPDADDDSEVTFAFTASDGELTASSTASLDLTSVNDAPTVALDNVTASLAEDTDTGTRIKVADIVISDDTLGTNALSLSGADAGLFEIVGTELYLKAGVSLDFESSPALNVSVLVDDATVGATPDDAATLLIAVTNINETPVATAADLGAIDEDGSRLITAVELLAGVTDVDGPSLTISDLSIQTGGGSLVDNGDGSWTYTPAADDDTAVTFAYTASDGELTASSTASLDLTPVNDAPVATAVDLGAIDEDGSRLITAAELLAGVSDIDGPSLMITDLSIQTGGGALDDNNDGTWSYTPAADDDTAVTFAFTASDGGLSASSTASLDLTPVNDAPTVALDNVTASLAEDTDTGTRIKVADIVISDDTLGTNALSLSGADAGLFEIVGTELYLKAGVSLDFESSPALNVSVLVDDDTVGATPDDAATLLIAVTNINETPVATAVDLGAIDEDGSRIITAAELLAGASDVDSPSLTISDLSIQTGGGSLVDNGDDSWTYTPDADDDTAVTFAYTAFDGELIASSTASLDLTPVNDAPVATALDLGAIDEDGSRIITAAELLAGASDVDGPSLTISNLSIQTGGGSLVDNGDDSWTYTPAADDDSAVTFVFTASDGELTASSTASLDLTSVNDAPVATAVDLGAIDEDVSRLITAVELLAGVTDIDGPTLTIADLSIQTGGGSLVDNNDGTWTYTPAADDDTAVTFAFTASDGELTASSTASLDLTPVNDPPTVALDNVTASLAEDTDTGTRIKVADIVISDDTLGTNALSLSGADAGLFEIVGTELYLKAGVSLDFESSPALDVSVLVDDATVGATPDDAATLLIAVTNINETPVATAVDLGAIDEDGSRIITAAELLAGASDVDGPSLTISDLSIQTGGGSLVDNGDDSWTYTPDADDDSKVTFAYTASDGDLTASSTASLDLTPVNDAPVTTAVDLGAIDEDGSRLITAAELLAGVSDIDGPSLTISDLSIQTGGGSLVDNGDDSWTYTPDADDDSEVTFAYTASDGELTASSTALLDLTPVNDAPVATALDLGAIDEDGSRIITAAELLAGVTDVDGPSLMITGLSIQTGGGALVDNNDGTWTYTPAADDDTAVTFAFTASDGELTASSTASLDLTPVNDAPRVALDNVTASLAEDTDTGTRIKVADIVISDDTLGTNVLSLSGADAGVFEIDGTVLYLKAGVSLDFESNPSLDVNVLVDDATVGATPDDTATLSIAVTNINEAPVALAVDLGAIDEDGSRLITAAELLAGVSDIDGPSLMITDLSIQTGGGALVDNNDGTWTYTPAADDDTAVTFAYTASDGELSASSTASLDLTSVNDAPVATAVDLGAIDEDGSRTITAAELLAGVTDVDGPATSITDLSIQTGGGSLVDNNDGTWTYTPDADDDSAVTFGYTAFDGDLAATSTASLDLTPVNDTPTVAPVDLGAINEDGSRIITAAELLAGASDVDSPSLTISDLSIQTGGGSLVDNGDDSWTYTPAADDDREVTFAFTASDGDLASTSTASLDLTPVNDAPVATAVDLGAIDEDGSRLITAAELLAGVSDIDGPATSITDLSIQTGGGALVDNGDDSWTYTPDADDDSDVTFAYTAFDGELTAYSTASLDLTPVNDAPVATAVDLGAINEDGSRIITAAELLAGASDVDGPSLTISDLSIQTGGGALFDNGDDSWTYTPDADDDSEVTFAYTASDGELTASSTASLDLTPVNDAPTGSVSISGRVQEYQTLTADASDLADADGLGSLSYQWQRSTDGGVTFDNIAGATAGTYTLGDDDVDAQVRVITSYTDGQGTAESVASEATGEVVATSIIVTTTEDVVDANDGQTSLREAIALANSFSNRDADGDGSDHDTITFASDIGEAFENGGTIYLGDYGELLINSDITINGDVDGDGVADVTLDANTAEGAEDASSRIFSIQNTSVDLEGLVVTGGNANSSGGGVLLAGGRLDLLNTTVSNNTSNSDGGGLLISGGGVVTLNNVTLSNNVAGGSGGGFASLGSVAVLTDTTISGNSASTSGGGFVTQGGTETLTNTTISDNHAGNEGGGIASQAGRTTMTNTTLSGNGANSFGGGISLRGGEATLVNATLSGNSASTGGGLSKLGGSANLSNTLVLGNSGGETFGGYSDDGGNIVGGKDVEDVFAEIDLDTGGGLLADNGGPVKTIALKVDLTNPALDAAVSDGSFMIEATDARGESAFDQSDVDNGLGNADGRDIGAYELTRSVVNNAPTGEVLIVGTAEEDRVLNADASGLADANGLGTFSYQWQRSIDSGATFDDIAGATVQGYTLGDADVGALVQVVASYTDGQGTAESVASAATGPVANINDAPTGAVLITGTAEEDQVLTADASGLADADGLGTLSFQWRRSTDGGATFDDIAGATSADYTLGDADVGALVQVAASYTDGQGTAESVTSAVVNVKAPPTGSVLISGTAEEDQMLTVDASALADANGLGTLSYHWQRSIDGGSTFDDIAGATAETYTLGDDDVGALVQVVVSYTDGQGTAESVTSAPTGAVANVNDTPTGSVLISGTVEEEQVLTADASGLADADGLGLLSYQWQRSTDGGATFDDIAGATAESYTLANDDVGAVVQVVVSYTDGRGTTESVASDPTAEVVEPSETPSLIVTTAEDVVDANDGVTSLREALAYANATDDADGDGFGNDKITFDESVFGDDATIYLGANYQLIITSDVTIDGDIDGDGRADVTLNANSGAGQDDAVTRVMMVSGGTSHLEGLIFTGGNDLDGAGVRVSGGAAVVLENSILTGNASYLTGGGLYIQSGSMATLTNSTVSGNNANYGGGITNRGTVELNSTTVSGNNAAYGGGIYNQGTATLVNSTIADNEADLGGGLSNYSEATLINATFSGNVAENGGGIRAANGSLALTNSLVLGNSGGEVTGGYTSGGGNLVGDGAVAAEDVFENTHSNTAGTVAGVLADNGGLVETIALKSVADNPALDRGGSVAETTDANGNSRDVDLYDAYGADIDNGGTVDAGAVELAAVPETASLVVDTTQDIVDAYDGLTSLREALAYANSVDDADGIDGTNDTITFAAGVGDAFENGGIIVLGGSQFAITSDVTILGDVDGDGKADITLDGNNASRVLSVGNGTSVLTSLNITGGNAGRGGGISVAPSGDLTVTNSTIFDNYASIDGGGVWNDGSISLLNTTLSGNTAADFGGGLYSGGSADLTNVTLAGNAASDGGGGIVNVHGNVSLVNTTVTGNTATDGGGILSDIAISHHITGSTTLTNSLVLGNSGDEVSGVYTGNGNLVGGADIATVFAEVDLDNGGGLLADNGGPVETVALNERSDNPALDFGNPVSESTDANGNVREVDIPGVDNGGAVDAGAVEVQPEMYSLVVTTTQDVVDADDGLTSLREALAIANADYDASREDNAVYTITFAGGSGEAFENDATISLGVDGQLQIASNVMILGDVDDDGESDVTLDASGASRVLIVSNGSSTIDGITVTGGNAGQGGGVRINSNATLTLTDSVIADNTATANGGGLWNAGSLTLAGTTVSGNTAEKGGGLWNNAGALTLTGATVSDNSASKGGGIYDFQGVTELTNTTLYGNVATGSSAAGYGGGLVAQLATVNLTNTTVTGNTAVNGGGLYNLSSTMTLTNTLVLGNSGGETSDVHPYVDGGGNFVGDGSVDANDVFAETQNLSDGTEAGVLADNGGPVETVALKLTADNPALDRGDVIVESTDANGNARAHDIPGLDNGGALDAGAVEVQSDEIEASTLIVNTTADVVDATDGVTSLREAIAFANNMDDADGVDGSNDTITFDSSVFGNGAAIYLEYGQLRIMSDITIDGDVDGDGKADVTVDGNSNSRVFFFGGEGVSTIQSLIVSGGNSGDAGGGIRVDYDTTLEIADSAISDNVVSYVGGGVVNYGILSLTNTTVSGNSASSGGGIANSGELILTNTTVVENTANVGGGLNTIESATLVNTTISGNTADIRGGGINNESIFDSTAFLGLENTIVLGNSGGEVSGGYSDDGGNLIGDGIIDANDVFATTQNLPDGTVAGVVADNGGSVETIALKPDLDNPALDRGDAISESTDANGNQREFDVLTVDNGGTVDAGAVELQSDEIEPFSLVVTTTEDVVDATDGVTSLREALAFANTTDDADGDDGSNDTITFDEVIFSGGETINLAGQLVLSSDVTIDGDADGDGASDVTVDAGGNSRVFLVNGGGASTLDSLVITGGQAIFGGGVRIEGNTSLSIVNSRISGNDSSNKGGGVHVNEDATLSMIASTVAGNYAKNDGGGIWSAGEVSLTNSTLSDNTANRDGGGLYNAGLFYDGYSFSGFIYAGSATLTNTTISGNVANRDGGGISSYIDLALINTTVSGNAAGGQGGGIINHFIFAADLTNSIVLGNRGGETSGGFFNNGGSSLIGGGASTAETVFADTYILSDGTVAGVLADNGGPVETIALKQDLSNPALDRGDPISETSDAAGGIREVDILDVDNGGTVDAGAVELQYEERSLVVTTTEDVVDRIDGLTSLREAIDFANSVDDADGDGSSNDTISFDEDVFGAGDTIYTGGGNQLIITSDVTINGDADGDGEADVTINANSDEGLDDATNRVVIIREGTSVFENLVITGGNANLSGAGIRVDSGASLAISDSTVTGNHAKGNGGGISNLGTITLTNTTISGNSSDSNGGGIDSQGTATLVNVTLSGNTAAGNGGGGSFEGNRPATLVNTTVSGNSATDGGGIHTNSVLSILTLTNTLVLGNGGGEVSGSYSGSGNLVGDGTIYASDVFADIDPLSGGGLLADNGGPVETIALLEHPSNPAIDTGSAVSENADANGNPRDVDIPSVDNGGTVDAGAVELSLQNWDVPSLVVTTTDDVVDALDGLISLREALAFADAVDDADGDGFSNDTISFDADVFAEGATIYIGGNDQLVIASDVTIDGDVDGDGESEVTISANSGEGLDDATNRVLIAEAGASTLESLVVTGGNTAASGGGIRIDTGARLAIVNSTVAGNDATGNGGGISNAGKITLTNTTISGNSSHSDGGGIDSPGTATLVNVTLSGNTATGNGGGGSFEGNRPATLVNTTVTGNSATYGGGVHTNSVLSILTLTNTLVLGNSGGEVNGSYSGNGNLVGDATTDAADVFAGTLVLSDGAVAGVLADNGGPVQTVALRTVGYNPALDIGNAVSETTDANGNPRDIDLPGADNGGTVDAGAVEVQEAFIETPSLLVTTTDDVVDPLDGLTSLREALAFANAVDDADGDGESNDTIAFASGIGEAFENGGTIILEGKELELTSDITLTGDLDGDGAEDVTLDANAESRVLFVSDGSAILDGLIITGGSASVGGGIGVAFGGSLALSDSTIIGNAGGGLVNSGTATLTHTTISNNTATNDGGGVANVGGHLSLVASTVSGNSTSANGGGIWNGAIIRGLEPAIAGEAILIDTTIYGNSATNGGGVYTGFYGQTELTNATISGNSASVESGGIFTNRFGALDLANSILLGNSAPENSEISIDAANVDATKFFGLNIVGAGSDTDASDQVINADPTDIFAETVVLTDGTVAGKLADNGGPVETIALKLNAANSAIDAAITENGGAIDPTDARGEDAYDAPVIDNGSGNTIGRDLGAYELLNDEPVITLLSDTRIQFIDTDVDDSHSASVALVAVTGNENVLGGADTFDFLTLDPVDQVADTVDWVFDLPQPVADNIAAGLDEGETVTLDYTVVIADELGQTDETVLSFRLDDEGMLV